MGYHARWSKNGGSHGRLAQGSIVEAVPSDVNLDQSVTVSVTVDTAG
jgi:hypothetical protein